MADLNGDSSNSIYTFFSTSGSAEGKPTRELPSMETCFASFDKDGDGVLDLNEFGVLCRALFRNERDEPYLLEKKTVQQMFNTFDINNDGVVDDKEFEACWDDWIKKIVRPVCALVAVDVQNDFITGSLAISNCPAQQNGEEVVEPINRLLDTVEFDCVFYTLDWHPENHVSFVDNVAMRKLAPSSPITDPALVNVYDTVIFQGPPLNSQKLWPRHCVQNSWGSKIHENLKIIEGSPFIYKGTHPDVDSYSAFFDNNKLSKTELDSELRAKRVTDVFICGIAYDVCVGATAFHAVELGYRTVLVDDACRGITHEDIQATKERLTEEHGVVADTSQVKHMIEGRDRRPELGLKLAVELRKNKSKIQV